MQATIEATLASDPTVDGILTLGPSVAGPALAAVDAAGKTVHLATFDLSADVLTAIKDGKMDFAIDQQQFLQGYLPIVILTNYAETRNLPTGNGTGPDHDRSRLRDHRRTPRPSSRSQPRASADLAIARRRTGAREGPAPVPVPPDTLGGNDGDHDGRDRSGHPARTGSDGSRSPSGSWHARRRAR